jgi:hypothetical protein
MISRIRTFQNSTFKVTDFKLSQNGTVTVYFDEILETGVEGRLYTLSYQYDVPYLDVDSIDGWLSGSLDEIRNLWKIAQSQWGL